MLTQMQSVDKKENYPQNDRRNIETINLKTPEELARSMEVMVELVRPDPAGRATLRGAICRMRGEPTAVTRDHAIDALIVLRSGWEKQDWQTRVHIVSRAIEIVGKTDA